MLNKLRSECSAQISHEELWYLQHASLAYLLLPFSGFVGLKVAFLTNHQNQQEANGKEEFHQTCYHIMLKQHSFPCFICHHSVRWLRSLYISLFKAQVFSTSASQNGYTGYFSSPSGTSLLKYSRGESRGEGNNKPFPKIQQNPVFCSPLQNCILLAALLNETLGLLTVKELWRVKRRSEKPVTRKIAAKRALSRSWRV